jgi:hypothetical protein
MERLSLVKGVTARSELLVRRVRPVPTGTRLLYSRLCDG